MQSHYITTESAIINFAMRDVVESMFICNILSLGWSERYLATVEKIRFKYRGMFEDGVFNELVINVRYADGTK